MVYQITSGHEERALKVFKPRFRVPSMVALTRRLAPFAELPGLQVCRRLVITPQQHDNLLTLDPDLLYAVVMPWIKGPTWMEVLFNSQAMTPEESLSLARGFALVLAGMEQEGLAHCDLSGPNVLLPMFAGAASDQGPVALVDVEQLYGPDLRKPETITSGSSGYTHRIAPEDPWSPEADRFAGAILLAEMLGWCDTQVREAAWGETYFDPDELQRDSQRYQLLDSVLRARWGDNTARLLERAWASDTLGECATFGEWLVKLPKNVARQEASASSAPPRPANDPSPLPHAPSLPTRSEIEELTRQLMAQGNDAQAHGKHDLALESYREASSLAPYGSPLATELASNIDALQSREPQPPSKVEIGRSDPAAQPATAYPEERKPLFATSGVMAQAPVPVSIQPANRSRTGSKRLWMVALPLILLALAIILVTLQSRAESTGATVTAITTSLAEATQSPAATSTSSTGYSASLLATLEQHEGQVRTVAFSPDGKALASGSSDGTLRLWDVVDSSLIFSSQVDTYTVESVAFSPDGQMIGTGSWNTMVQLWGLDGTKLRTLRGHKDTVESIAFSPDGQTLASASSDGGAWLWRLSDGVWLRGLDGNPSNVTSVLFSPDGTLVAGSLMRGSVILWSASQKEVPPQTLTAVTNFSTSVAFSPDGQLIASGAKDSNVFVWRVADHALLRPLRGHQDAVIDVAFSPDGELLASGSSDKTVRLWRVSDWSLVLTMPAHSSDVWDLSFSPDGKMLASASLDGTVKLWSLHTGR